MKPGSIELNIAAGQLRVDITNAFLEASSMSFTYDKMDNKSFVYGFLIAKGWSGGEASRLSESLILKEVDK